MGLARECDRQDLQAVKLLLPCLPTATQYGSNAAHLGDRLPLYQGRLRLDGSGALWSGAARCRLGFVQSGLGLSLASATRLASRKSINAHISIVLQQWHPPWRPAALVWRVPPARWLWRLVLRRRCRIGLVHSEQGTLGREGDKIISKPWHYQ